MPKPMLKPKEAKEHNKSILSLNKENKNNNTTSQLTKVEFNRILRKSRSKEYMEILSKLDAGGHVNNQDQVDEIISKISDEFPEINLTGILIGVISTCYLGKPYDVHIVDLAGNIIGHYKTGESLPHGLEKARSLAINPNYKFIEVYNDCCCCVSTNGSVSIIKV